MSHQWHMETGYVAGYEADPDLSVTVTTTACPDCARCPDCTGPYVEDMCEACVGAMGVGE